MRKAAIQVENEQLQESSDLLRALAHPVRLRILEFIDKNRAINVNKIYNALGLEQSITSQHLKTLRETGLVHTHREGKYVHYSLDYARLEIAVVAVTAFAKAAREWGVFEDFDDFDD